jgi:hypothetical protein
MPTRCSESIDDKRRVARLNMMEGLLKMGLTNNKPYKRQNQLTAWLFWNKGLPPTKLHHSSSHFDAIHGQ